MSSICSKNLLSCPPGSWIPVLCHLGRKFGSREESAPSPVLLGWVQISFPPRVLGVSLPQPPLLVSCMLSSTLGDRVWPPGQLFYKPWGQGGTGRQVGQGGTDQSRWGCRRRTLGIRQDLTWASKEWDARSASHRLSPGGTRFPPGVSFLACFHHTGPWGQSSRGAEGGVAMWPMHVLTQLCPALSDLTDCSPPGSSVHGILQTRLLERAAISSPRGPSQPRDRTRVSHIPCVGGRTRYRCSTCKTHSAHTPPTKCPASLWGAMWGMLQTGPKSTISRP